MTGSAADRGAEIRRSTVAGFGLPIFGVRGVGISLRRMGGGGSRNGVASHVEMRHELADGGEVSVDTSDDAGRSPDWVLVRRLLGRDFVEPFEFPLVSVVELERVPMRVVGRRRPVRVFRCGRSWIALTRCGGRVILMYGSGSGPGSFEIVRLSDDEVREALETADEAMRRAYDQMKEGGHRDAG